MAGGVHHSMEEGPVSEAAWQPRSGARFALISLLALAMAAGTATQFAVPVLGPLLLTDLGMSRAQLGTLTSAFYVVGALTSPAAGRLTDRVGGRTGVAATFLLGAVGLAGLGIAPTYPFLILAAAVGGLSAAASNPATNRLVLAAVGDGHRGLVVGFKQSGVQLGALMSGAILPTLGVAVGWRPTLVLSGTAALLGIVAVLAIIPADADRGRGTRLDTAPGSSHPTVTVLCIFAVLMGLGIASVTTYLPVFAVEQLGVSIATAGLVTSVVGLLGIASRLAWGLAADRVPDAMRILPVLGIGAMVGIGLLAAATSLGTWAMWLGAAVFGATAMGWNGVAMLVAMTTVPPERAGWATGRVILFFYIGLVISPVPFGVLADRTGSYLAGWIGVTAAFLTASTVTAFLGRRSRRVSHAPDPRTP